MKRVATGIPGLDDMLGGGLPAGRPYLVAGGAGTGKTVMGVQFLLEGAIRGERCVYITLEEPVSELRENMLSFDWDISKIDFIDMSPELTPEEISESALTDKNMAILDEFRLKQKIVELTEKNPPDRLVFDSVTMLLSMYRNIYDARRELLLIMKRLSENNVTSLFISETPLDINRNQFIFEAFLARGVIKLYAVNINGERRRGIQIEKMRGTRYDEHIRPIQITGKGIIVHADSIMV